MRKIHRLQVLDSGYSIIEIPDRKVPVSRKARHWGYKFYRSKEMRPLDADGKTGGTIPGCHEYRYDISWRPVPNWPRLEMNNANGGGTKIQGESYVGTSDSRIPNDLHVEFHVDETPTEIEAAFEEGGERADEMNETISEALHWAEQEAFENAKELVYQAEQNCDHQHVVTTGHDRAEVAYCEDCGRSWDASEFDHEKSENNLKVVGEV
jgi:hypothetical protein